MKLLSYSLFGDAELYTLGMVANARLAPVVYPGWRVRVYLGAGVPAAVVRVLERRGVEIVDRGQRPLRGPWEPLFWRFEAAGDPGVEAFAVRDADSRIGARERAAVAEWEASGKRFHAMRDHPFHGVPMLAGMWGGRSGSRVCPGDSGQDRPLNPDPGPRNPTTPAIPGIVAMIDDWAARGGPLGGFIEKWADQDFLAGEIWPLAGWQTLAHDSWSDHGRYDPRGFGCHEARPFPAHADDGLAHACEVKGGDECDRAEVREEAGEEVTAEHAESAEGRSAAEQHTSKAAHEDAEEHGV